MKTRVDLYVKDVSITHKYLTLIFSKWTLADWEHMYCH